MRQEYRSYSWHLRLAILAVVGRGLQKEVVLPYFHLLIPPQGGRECSMHTLCMRLHPCNIPVDSGVPLMIIGKGLYEQNTTVNAGAAS